MRFFVTGEQKRQTLLNTIVLMFMGYIALFWISNGMMFFHKMSLNPESVVQYYLGSEETFTQPKSYQSLLEVTHFHLFSMGILVLTLSHLLLFTPLAMNIKIWLTGLSFLSAVADEAAGWLVRFVHPGFAWFKVGAFRVLELSLLALLVFVSISLVVQRLAQRERTGSEGATATAMAPSGGEGGR